MRIAQVTGMICRAPAAPGSAAAADTVLVRVEADSGLVGWGEGYGAGGSAAATLEALNSMIIGRCLGAELPAQGLPENIRHVLYGASAGGPFAYALSGVEMALWDLHGKMLGQPVHALLGAAQAQAVAGCVRLPAEARLEATLARLQYALAEGAAAVHLEGGSEEVMVAVARECAANGKPVALHAGCRWGVHEAGAALRRLEPLQLAWVADPLWPPENLAGLAELRTRTHVPVAAGFNAASIADFQRMLDQRAVDVAALDVTRIGGLGPWARLAAKAREQGIGLFAQAPSFGPGLLASLHACAALTPDATVEYPDVRDAVRPFGQRLAPRDGRFAIPTGPGLGFDPEPAFLASAT